MDPIAITFDFWNTLVVEPGGELRTMRRDAARASLTRSGVEVDDELLDAKLVAAGALQSEAWLGGRAYRPADAAEALADSLPKLDAAARADLVRSFLGAGADAELELTDGAGETVHELAQAGVRLGIICDVGLTGSPHLRGFLERKGLLKHFTGWAFSDEVGAFKPSPVIFAHALEQLGGIAPERAIHIGDLKRTDVAGSRAFGMTSIRYRGAADDDSPGEEADAVFDDLTELTAKRALELIG